MIQTKSVYKCAFCDNVVSTSRKELELHLNLVHSTPKDQSKIVFVREEITLV